MKKISFIKISTIITCVLLLHFISFKALSQNQQNTLIHCTVGVSNFNSGDFINPYFYNEIGLMRKNDMSNFSGFSFGIIFKQIRSKTIFFNDTKSYISCPLYLNLNFRQIQIQTGVVCDLYAFRYINYFNKNNEVFPYLLNFRSLSLAQNRKGPISFPFSFGYVANASYFFKSTRFGLLLSFQMTEIISLYGRNFNLNDNNEKTFYYPSSFSFGFLYKLN